MYLIVVRFKVECLTKCFIFFYAKCNYLLLAPEKLINPFTHKATLTIMIIQQNPIMSSKTFQFDNRLINQIVKRSESIYIIIMPAVPNIV